MGWRHDRAMPRSRLPTKRTLVGRRPVTTLSIAVPPWNATQFTSKRAPSFVPRRTCLARAAPIATPYPRTRAEAAACSPHAQVRRTHTCGRVDDLQARRESTNRQVVLLGGRGLCPRAEERIERAHLVESRSPGRPCSRADAPGDTRRGNRVQILRRSLGSNWSRVPLFAVDLGRYDHTPEHPRRRLDRRRKTSFSRAIQSGRHPAIVVRRKRRWAPAVDSIPTLRERDTPRVSLRR